MKTKYDAFKNADPLHASPFHSLSLKPKQTESGESLSKNTMEGGKTKEKQSAVSLQEFVSVMAPLIDLEKVSFINPILFFFFVHFYFLIVIYLTNQLNTVSLVIGSRNISLYHFWGVEKS